MYNWRVPEQSCNVRAPLTAWRSDEPSRAVTVLPGVRIWLDLSQKGDPIVFEVGNLRLAAKRADFLESVEISRKAES